VSEAVRLRRTEERKKTTKQIMANKTLHSIIFETINSVYLKVKEKLEDIKGVNGRRTQYNGNKEQVRCLTPLSAMFQFY
jgi:hypothetical protein